MTTVPDAAAHDPDDDVETAMLLSPHDSEPCNNPPNKACVMSGDELLKYGALVVLVLQNSALALTMRYSRTHSNGHLYIAR